MSTDDSPVRLVIPARTRYLRRARLTAAGIAGDNGFGLEAIEDLRVAVDEMCATLLEGVPEGAEIELVYRATAEGLLIEGSAPGTNGVPELHPVARELLAMTADDYSVEPDGESISFRLVKHRAVAAG